MKLFIGMLALMMVSFASAGTAQKLEGQCSGLMEDNTQISFSYYSNYEGCSGKIAGSIKFSAESGLGLHKGKRTFENQKDIYSFQSKVSSGKEVYRLTFEDSTGNISGVLDYFDTHGEKQTITVQCVIRDFHYDDCSLPI